MTRRGATWERRMHCDTPTTGKVNPPPPCPKSFNPSAEQLTEIGSEFEGERERRVLCLGTLSEVQQSHAWVDGPQTSHPLRPGTWQVSGGAQKQVGGGPPPKAHVHTITLKPFHTITISRARGASAAQDPFTLLCVPSSSRSPTLKGNPCGEPPPYGQKRHVPQ